VEARKVDAAMKFFRGRLGRGTKRNPGRQWGWINQGGEANKKSGIAAFFAFPE
jgi:hypothetical protein